mgnify:CR=1 FL=1|nr:MAG TPA: Ogr/Delta-like zinc finger protein [Caudoviricetes sp.]
MNNEKKQAPRCPYCDAEMRLEDNEDVLFGLFADEERMYWYQCNTPLCGIHSPAKHTKVEEKIEYGMTVLDPMLVVSAASRHCVEFITTDAEKLEMNVEDLNIKWRCWMRNPTEKQMRDTPWEEKS